MNSKIRRHVDGLFEDAPRSRRVYEIKEEILSNVNDSYNDLLESGMDEGTAYNRAIANIGDVEALIQKNSDIIHQQEEYRKQSGVRVALAVILYILCPTPVLILGDEIGVILLLAMVAFATGILIYNGYMKPKYVNIDDDLYEEFIDWKNTTDPDRRAKKQISSIIWMITTVVFFVVSFNYGNWYISWVIFLIGAAVEKIYYTYCDMKEDNK